MLELIDQKNQFQKWASKHRTWLGALVTSPQNITVQSWAQVCASHKKIGRAINMQIICSKILWQRFTFSLVSVICLQGRGTHMNYFPGPAVGLAPCTNENSLLWAWSCCYFGFSLD